MKWLVLFAALLWVGCNETPDNHGNEGLSVPALKDVFEDAFEIGAALKQWQIAGDDVIVVIPAKDIHDSMTHANFNAYLWWYLKRFYSFLADDEGPQGTEEGMITKRGYVVSHYSRFIRPGYVRKEAVYNPQDNVFVSVYEGDGRLVIVALNLDFFKVRQPFVILNSGRSITSMDPYVTTADMEENVSRKETIPLSGETPEFAFDIPARSIVTFVESV